jgi:phosphate starvation-inducible membrane PsiE
MSGLLNRINEFIINPIISVAVALALVVFLWGVVQFIYSETSDSKREEGKKKIVYGLVGLFIMFTAYGIINFILNTFDIRERSYPFN